MEVSQSDPVIIQSNQKIETDNNLESPSVQNNQSNNFFTSKDFLVNNSTSRKSGSTFRNGQYSPGAQGETAKMLMTGMSSAGMQTSMMQAKNTLKVMTHQQQALQARLIKLNKEEEQAQRRIREAQKRAEFIQQVQAEKQQAAALKLQAYRERQDKEEQNRIRGNSERGRNKMIIEQNINKIKHGNFEQSAQIKEQQQKIKETIINTRIAMAEEKKQTAQEIYKMKKDAQHRRKFVSESFKEHINQSYGQRIEDTHRIAMTVANISKKLEEKEAQMLQKLQQTYNQEKLVVKRLNDLVKS